MAAPIAGFVQLPTDSGNTGKKVRTQTRVVGADTVHEHHFVSISSRKIDGVYFAVSGVVATVAAADNGTTAARLGWLEMPVGGTKRGRLRRFCLEWALGAAVAADATDTDAYWCINSIKNYWEGIRTTIQELFTPALVPQFV